MENDAVQRENAALRSALKDLAIASESAFRVLDARVAGDIRNRDRFTTECLRASYGKANHLLDSTAAR